VTVVGLLILNAILTSAVLVLAVRIRQSQASDEDVDEPGGSLTDEQFLEENLNSRLRRIQTAQFSALGLPQRADVGRRREQHGDEKRS
jgi:hypothetical protein